MVAKIPFSMDETGRQEHKVLPLNGKSETTIQGLLDNQGAWQSTEKGIERTILEYYTSIFTSDRPTQFTVMEQVLDPKVIGETNMVLTREFQPDEVWRTLQQMHPTKSPGPDGMPPIFYLKF